MKSTWHDSLSRHVGIMLKINRLDMISYVAKMSSRMTLIRFCTSTEGTKTLNFVLIVMITVVRKHQKVGSLFIKD